MKNGLKRVINLYHARGIHVNQINTDNEFECIKNNILPTNLNVAAAEEHVGEIERSIRTMKEGTRYDVHRLPYSHYPTVMIKGLITKRVKDLNQLPSNNGISNTLSSSTLMTGKPSPDFLEVIKLNFGDYVQAYNAKKITNNNKSRAVGAISLYPSGNEVGGWYFISLATGQEVHRNGWTELHMGDDVLQRVKHIALKQGQINIDSNFKYEWELGNAIEDIEIQEIDEKEEDDSEERTPPKLLNIEIETNHIEESSENEEIFVEDKNDVIEMEVDNVDLLDVVDNIIIDGEESTDNEENKSQMGEERSHENEERLNENEERPNENKERHCEIQEHTYDENINDNIHDNRITVDDEEIIDEIRPLPSTAQKQSFLKSGLRPRNKTTNSHRDSYSKEFIYRHVNKNRVTWKK